VCCSALQCVVVRYSVLQCVTVSRGSRQKVFKIHTVLQCVAVCCSVLQCVAVCCSVLHSMKDVDTPSTFKRQTLWCRVSLCAFVHCSTSPLPRSAEKIAENRPSTKYFQETKTVVQCAAVRCSVLQCVAVCCRVCFKRQRLWCRVSLCAFIHSLQHVPQRTATHCNTLQNNLCILKVRGGEDSLSGRSFSTKEPLIIRFFCGK